MIPLDEQAPFPDGGRRRAETAGPAAGTLPGRQLVGRYAVLILLDAGAKACGFAATLAMARHFGADGIGALGFAQQTAVFGLIIARAGLDVYAVRAAIQAPGRIGSIATTVGLLRLALGAVAYLLLIGIALLVTAFGEVAVLVALFGLTFFSGAVSLQWISQATQRTHVFGLANLATQGLFLALILCSAALDLGTWSVPLALVTAESLVSFALLVWSQRRVAPLRRPLPIRPSLTLLRQSLPIGGAQLLRAVAIGSDVVLVGSMLTLTEVGQFVAAYKVFMLGGSLVYAYAVILYPHLASQAEDPRALRRELGRSCRRVLSVAVPALAVGTWWAEELLVLLFGAAFEAGAAPLRILLGTLLVYLLNGHLRYGLIVAGRQRADLRNVAVAAAVHVGFKAVLIPLLGNSGAALGSLLGEAVLALLGWRAIRAVWRDRAPDGRRQPPRHGS